MSGVDTAWVLVCSALVLLMTPGVAFFYGGLVRRKNIVSTLMYSFVSIGLVGVVWVLWGYSLAFGPDIGGFVGNLEMFGLNGVSAETDSGIPDLAQDLPNLIVLLQQGHENPVIARVPGLLRG